jgi:hypothetical protein
MPRDRFGDEDSFDAPPRKGSAGVVLIVALAALALVVVVPGVLLAG